MSAPLSVTLSVLLATILFTGCGPGERPVAKPADAPTDEHSESPTEEKIDTSEPVEEHAHTHEGDDTLVWLEKDVPHEGYLISLGHHGEHLHAASFVEPAVMITKDGIAVPDAEVFNALVAPSGGEVIRKEVPTVYEPATDDEPAHYAQGKLHIPKGSKLYLLRFRIVFPGETAKLVRDVGIVIEQ